ncbi:hypothetical protein BDW62DRAFT_176326 [Aspergillus aurantiobrunneus]
MPLIRKHTSPSQPSSSTPEPKRSLRSLLNRKLRSSVNHPTKTHQAPVHQEPNFNIVSHPTALSSLREPETSSRWEDIDPPAEYLLSSSRSLATTTSLTSHYHPTGATRTQERTTTAATIPPPTMHNSPQASPTPSLPGYNDVSGAVVVDVDGYPRFLTLQEERERKDALERAVRERMMGLPRRAEFSWEASGGPVLPRYELASSGAGVGGGSGGGKGVST